MGEVPLLPEMIGRHHLVTAPHFWCTADFVWQEIYVTRSPLNYRHSLLFNKPINEMF